MKDLEVKQLNEKLLKNNPIIWYKSDKHDNRNIYTCNYQEYTKYQKPFWWLIIFMCMFEIK
jgi:hypothetical protein